jgi:hypothetical protein
MANELSGEVVSAIAIGDLKAISEQPAVLSHLAYSSTVASTNLSRQNAVADQQANDQLGMPLVATATESISDTGPLAARSAVDVLSNNELAQTIADLKASVDALAEPHGGPGPRGLQDLDLSIDAAGQLVIRSPIPPIFIAGSFAKEDVQITGSERGITIRVRQRR